MGSRVEGRLAAWAMESQDQVASGNIPFSFYRKPTVNCVESLNNNSEMVETSGIETLALQLYDGK